MTTIDNYLVLLMERTVKDPSDGTKHLALAIAMLAKALEENAQAKIGVTPNWSVRT